MREGGFEPPQALSYYGLNVARLTAPAFPLWINRIKSVFKYNLKIRIFFSEAGGI